MIGRHLAVSRGMGIFAFTQALTGFGSVIVSAGAGTQVSWIAHFSVSGAAQLVAATLGTFTGWIFILPDVRLID